MRLFKASSTEPKKLRIVISLGVLLDTQIERAIAYYCASLKASPAQLGAVLLNPTVQKLISEYKMGKFDTPSFFAQLKEAVVTLGLDISKAEASGRDWIMEGWNAQTELILARVRELQELASVAEIYIYSDTNPAHIEKVGGIEVFSQAEGGAVLIPEDRIFLSYQRGMLDVSQLAMDRVFSEVNPAKPVLFIHGGAISKFETPDEKVRREAMEARLRSSEAKDEAHFVAWSKDALLTDCISHDAPEIAVHIGMAPSAEAGAGAPAP
jgi:hypothetical protein